MRHKRLSFFGQAALFLLPWGMRKRLLERFWHYRLEEGSRIGFSLIEAQRVHLGKGATIGHGTLIRNLEALELGAHASLGHFNWISGLAEPLRDKHFTKDEGRESTLSLGAHTSVLHRMILDCTNAVSIGAFTTVAGNRSQFVTHGIDLKTSRQSSSGIKIGDYCMVGTGSILLKGTALPNKSALGAGSVLTHAFTEEGQFYAGVPARKIKAFEGSEAYFHRTEGYVD